MAKRTYVITIHTARSKGVHEQFNDVAYPKMPKSYHGDTILIQTQKIKITATRNNTYGLGDIIEYKQNTLYHQAFKALLYLYLKRGSRVRVRSINVKRGSNYEESLNLDLHRQPLMGEFNLQIPIPNDAIKVIFSENKDGDSLRAVVSHFLIAISSADRYIRFEHLWRAFEQIAMWHKYHGGTSKPKEFDALVEMRNLICSRQDLFSQTLGFINNVNKTKIDLLHWDKLIRNDYSKSNKTKLVNDLYDDLLVKNKDERLIGVFKKAMAIFSTEIDNRNKKNDFETVVNSYSTQSIRNDAHVLSLILCKYCYFMRNKMFHGEIADYSFCFTNHTEDDDITDFLNELLACFVNELISKFVDL